MSREGFKAAAPIISPMRGSSSTALAPPIASPAGRMPARARLVRAIPWTIAAALALVVVGLGIRLRMREPLESRSLSPSSK